MTKRRTVLMVILSLFLAAMIAAAALFGVSLSRSAFSDSSETYAGEARWQITAETGEVIEDAAVSIDRLRPEYTKYTGAQRTKEFFGVVAVLENVGDVAATVAVEETGVPELVFDGCLSGDDGRYAYDDVMAHFAYALYYSYDSDKTLEDIEGMGSLSGLEMTLAAGSAPVYIYADITWTTDIDVYSVRNDYEAEYDGTYGDDFDTWAGQHLVGIVFHADIICDQAE